MKEVLCKICNVPAAFPYSVKEPFICISCYGTHTQRAFESNGAITEKTDLNMNPTDLQATPVTDLEAFWKESCFEYSDRSGNDYEYLPKEVFFEFVKPLIQSNISLQSKVSALEKALASECKRDGKWLDKWGCCRVCDGEIPYGHTNECDLYKMEQEIATLKTQAKEVREMALREAWYLADKIAIDYATAGDYAAENTADYVAHAILSLINKNKGEL